MSDETTNVISISTREPYVPQEEDSVNTVSPDPDITEILATLNEQNESGRVRGFAFIYWDPVVQCFQRGVVIPRDDAANNSLRFIGSFKLLEEDLLTLVSETSDYFTDPNFYEAE